MDGAELLAALVLGEAGVRTEGGDLLLAVSDLLIDLDRSIRWGVPTALVVLGAVFAERERGSPKLTLLHFLGDASYSIYIWHVLAGIVVTAILLRAGIPHSLHPLLIVLGSLALSLLCYLLIERPILRLMRASRLKTIPQ